MSMTKAEKRSQFAVMFVAFMALFISVWQGYMTQKHNKLTVRPLLNMTIGTVSKPNQQEFYINLTNQGYGPAKIKAFEISVDGKVQAHWNAAVQALGDSLQMTGAYNFDEGDVFAAGREEHLLELIDYRGQDRIKVKIVYLSIYDEEFTEEEIF